MGRKDSEQKKLLSYRLCLCLCGGLTLGRLAPRYATTRRVLAFRRGNGVWALVFAVVLFDWTHALIQDRLIDRRIGGYINPIRLPPDVILRQIVWALVWIAVCVLGTWLGLRWRDRKPYASTTGHASARAAGIELPRPPVLASTPRRHPLHSHQPYRVRRQRRRRPACDAASPTSPLCRP